ncbi:hypothetical protein Tco_0086272 [Tanacetum coccineum]
MPSSWKTTDTKDVPSGSSKQTTVSQSRKPVEDAPIPDDVHILDTKDTNAAHLSKIKPRPDWLKPIPKEERSETPEPDWVVPLNDLPEPENNWPNAFATSYKDLKENKLLQKTSYMSSFIKWYCRQIGKLKLSKAYLEGPAYKIDLVNPKGHRVVPDVSKPLPLGCLPGQVTIQPQFFFNKDLEYLVSGSKERRSALHSAHSDRRAVKSHMKILSLISESDFRNLHPNDFEDLYLLHLQGKLNHLSSADKVHLFNAVNLWIRNIVIRKRVEDLQLGIESYQTKLNLTEPSWDATNFLFKEDYTIVSKTKAVIYRDINDQKKMMRETEVHKFSDCCPSSRILLVRSHLNRSNYLSLFKV